MEDDGPALVSATVDPNGLIISAHVYDESGTLLAFVENNHFHAVAQNVCAHRPDLSTFLVEDFHRKELLYVHYLNPRTINVRGYFAYPKTVSAQVTTDLIKIGNARMGGSCLAFSGKALLGLGRAANQLL